MLDLFTIFTKGGIVLWYFQGLEGSGFSLSPAVNALVKTVLLQERGAVNGFNHESLKLQFKLDNEFDLVFVVVYQRVLQLSYIDKLLDQVYLEFRDQYKSLLDSSSYSPRQYTDFTLSFKSLLSSLETEQKLLNQKPKQMKSWEDSKKKEKITLEKGDSHFKKPSPQPQEGKEEIPVESVDVGNNGAANVGMSNGGSPHSSLKMKKLIKARQKKTGGGSSSRSSKGSSSSTSSSSNSSGGVAEKKKKENRTWGGSLSSQKVDKDVTRSLNYNLQEDESISNGVSNGFGEDYTDTDASLKGSMVGDLQPFQQPNITNGVNEDSEEEEEDSEEEAPDNKQQSSGRGLFSFFKSLTSGRTITKESMMPAMDKMKEHLITKNVAAEIADKLCGSVVTKLEGKTIGTFRGVQSVIRASMEESLVQILSPKRRIDLLHDAMQARKNNKPYVVTFCGVNGVGKSTNLAKLSFWLLENGLRVLIAGCDTFRSGAVEQLRTHTRRLASLHPPEREGGPPQVMLFEQGYGKDAAGIAMAAISFARVQKYDVVLVDTAGRMQDNEPLMKALSKLIHINTPDLVLFVGEALVGNEAVDQLVKFNRALIDHADSGEADPRAIDGIVLTKFDTIDDKVGAAISMTYTTGQPIVFIGTGQTYKDLRTLNVQAVVSALLK